MKQFLRSSATSLTALVFFVVGTSGVMLYFHLFASRVRELHETLGLLFAAAALLHLYFNWKPMTRYFSQKGFWGYGAAVIIVAALFIATAQTGPNPKKALIEGMLHAPLEHALPVLGVDAAQMQTALGAQGIDVTGAGSLDEIARKNGVSPFAIVMQLTAEVPR